jgi:hypothetical protein
MLFHTRLVADYFYPHRMVTPWADRIRRRLLPPGAAE